MSIMLIALVQFIGLRATYALRADIKGLAWTTAGHLLAFTDNEVVDLAAKRSRRLVRAQDDAGFKSLILNSSKTKGIGDGFVIDLRTLQSRPVEEGAAWEGDQLVEIRSAQRGKYVLLRGGRRTPIAPGWFVLGLSNNLRLALACRKEPFDGDTTYLLRLDKDPAQATIAGIYPKTSDDHQWLSGVKGPGPGGRVVVELDQLAADLRSSYLAGSKLKPIELPHPSSLMPVDCTIDWVDKSTPWAVVKSTLMFETSKSGFDTDTLDLWNSQSGLTIRVAKASGYWKADGPRGAGPSVGAYSVDWANRRIAYVVSQAGKGSQVFIRRLDIGG